MDCHATEIAAHVATHTLIEPGAASNESTAAPQPSAGAGWIRANRCFERIPAKRSLAIGRDIPRLRIVPVVRDFSELLNPENSRHSSGRLLPGSTIGNFEPEETDDLLDHFAQLAGPGGG